MSKKNRLEARERAAEFRRQAERRGRNRKIIKWFLAFGVLAALIALVVSSVVSNSQREEQKQEEVAALELNTPSLATATGSFAVDSSGAAVPLDKADQSLPRVEFILDLHCGGCRIVETALSDTMESMIKDGEAQFYFTPVSFMNRASNDDYSARAASTLIEVAETDPEHFLSYIQELYKNFPPEGNSYPAAGVSYDDLARVAKTAGVSEEAIEKFDEQRFRLWVLENTKVAEDRTEIFPEGISTPTVLVGGELVEEDGRFALKDFTRVNFQGSDVVGSFLDTFNRSN